MRATVVITFATCSALSFILCAGAYPQAATEGAVVTGGVSTTVPAVHPRIGVPGLPSGAPSARGVQGGTAGAIPGSSPTTFHDSTNDLYLAVGKTVLVDTQYPIIRVATGLGKVAIASVVSPTEVMVDGETPGETSLIIWDSRGGRQFFNVTVRKNEMVQLNKIASVRRELRQELPGQKVMVNMTNGSVLLRGTVKDLVSSQRAAEIASTAGKVVNLLNVDLPSTKPQVLLKVQFASIDLSRARTLGINLFNLGLGNTVNAITTGQFSPPTVAGGSSSGSSSSSSSSTTGFSGSAGQAKIGQDLNIITFFPGVGLGATIQAMINKGLVQVLAQPNLVTEDGKEASFLAGGQFPYPVVQGGGTGTPATVTIQFKNYGVSLDFLPTITPQNTIRLEVNPTVSALDYTNQVQISGFSVPGLTERSVNTQVNLADGESFLIGGLLNQNVSQTLQKIPWISDIPILGKFFQSIQTTKSDTELIVIVTPEIVAPIPAGKSVPRLNYPKQFLPHPSTIPMHQPDAKTPANTLPKAPATIPVEQLIESMKPEKALSGGVGGGAMGGTGSMGSGGSTGAGLSGGASTH